VIARVVAAWAEWPTVVTLTSILLSTGYRWGRARFRDLPRGARGRSGPDRGAAVRVACCATALRPSSPRRGTATPIAGDHAALRIGVPRAPFEVTHGPEEGARHEQRGSAAAALAVARRHPARLVGLALFAFVLLPALNVSAFVPDPVVHDRDLYIPLLGALAVLVSVAADALGDLASVGRARAPAVVLAAAAVVSVPLLAVTRRYDGASKTDIDLWTWAVRSDPTSASSLTQLAPHLEQERAGTRRRAACSIRPSLSARI